MISSRSVRTSSARTKEDDDDDDDDDEDSSPSSTSPDPKTTTTHDAITNATTETHARVVHRHRRPRVRDRVDEVPIADRTSRQNLTSRRSSSDVWTLAV